MSIPELTPLQFMILGLIGPRGACGKEIRATLRRAGVRRSGPSFYQLMSRMEDRGLIDGRYEKRDSVGRSIRVRCYEMTAAGRRAWEGTRAFYVEWGRRFDEILPTT